MCMCHVRPGLGTPDLSAAQGLPFHRGIGSMLDVSAHELDRSVSDGLGPQEDVSVPYDEWQVLFW